jgi:hypothetical protein
MIKYIIICLTLLSYHNANATVTALDNELKSLTFEQFLEKASGECRDWININTDIFCPCFEKRLRETATDREKYLYIIDWGLLRSNSEKLDEWIESEDGKEFFKYKKDIYEYCRTVINDE